jgi:hypothetical protein
MNRSSTKRDAAAEFLKKELAGGARRANDLISLANESGHNKHTLNSAANEIGISKQQDAKGWTWKLDVTKTDDHSLPAPMLASFPNGPSSNFSAEEIVWWAQQFDDHPAVAALLGLVDLYDQDLVECHNNQAVIEMHNDARSAIYEVRDEVLGDMEKGDSLSSDQVKDIFLTIEKKLRTLID